MNIQIVPHALHHTTSVDDGVVMNIKGYEYFSVQVGGLTTYLVIASRGEASLLPGEGAVEG